MNRGKSKLKNNCTFYIFYYVTYIYQYFQRIFETILYTVLLKILLKIMAVILTGRRLIQNLYKSIKIAAKNVFFRNVYRICIVLSLCNMHFVVSIGILTVTIKLVFNSI